MTDAELEQRLKSAALPERQDEYWDQFPSQVRFELRHRTARNSSPRRSWRTPLVWAGDFAVTVTLVLFFIEFQPLQTVSNVITRHEQQVWAQVARLDKGMHRLMLNTDGMGYLLADAN